MRCKDCIYCPNVLEKTAKCYPGSSRRYWTDFGLNEETNCIEFATEFPQPKIVEIQLDDVCPNDIEPEGSELNG